MFWWFTQVQPLLVNKNTTFDLRWSSIIIATLKRICSMQEGSINRKWHFYNWLLSLSNRKINNCVLFHEKLLLDAWAETQHLQLKKFGEVKRQPENQLKLNILENIFISYITSSSLLQIRKFFQTLVTDFY